MNPIDEAVERICKRLIDLNWTIRDDGDTGMPERDHEFPSILHAEITDATEGWREHRTKTLKAELALLTPLSPASQHAVTEPGAGRAEGGRVTGQTIHLSDGTTVRREHFQPSEGGAIRISYNPPMTMEKMWDLLAAEATARDDEVG